MTSHSLSGRPTTMHTDQFEQRGAARFPVDCPVAFEQGQGRSRNISATGISFLTEYLLRLSDQVSLVICLPHTPWVRCQGQVVRVKTEDRGYGVAVFFTDLSFEPRLGALEGD